MLTIKCTSINYNHLNAANLIKHLYINVANITIV